MPQQHMWNLPGSVVSVAHRKFPADVATLLVDMAEVGPEMGILQAGDGACSPTLGANSSALAQAHRRLL